MGNPVFKQNWKRENGWTNQAQILCGTSYDLREGLWMLRITEKKHILNVAIEDGREASWYPIVIKLFLFVNYI